MIVQKNLLRGLVSARVDSLPREECAGHSMCTRRACFPHVHARKINVNTVASRFFVGWRVGAGGTCAVRVGGSGRVGSGVVCCFAHSCQSRSCTHSADECRSLALAPRATRRQGGGPSTRRTTTLVWSSLSRSPPPHNGSAQPSKVVRIDRDFHLIW